MRSGWAVDPARLKLLHRKTAAAAARFDPVPGARVMAQFTNGEYYRGRVTAMSRADDGAPLCVVKFEEDGLVRHVPVAHVKPLHGAARA